MSDFSAKITGVTTSESGGVLLEIDIVSGAINAGDVIVWKDHDPVTVHGIQLIWRGENIDSTGETTTGLLLEGVDAADIPTGTSISLVQKNESPIVPG